jgi:hypothetical protein
MMELRTFILQNRRASSGVLSGVPASVPATIYLCWNLSLPLARVTDAEAVVTVVKVILLEFKYF